MAKSNGDKIKISKGVGKTAVRDAQRADIRAKKAMPGAFPTQRTSDSYQNFALKLGMGTDNAIAASTYGFNPITRIRTLLEWIHRGTWIGGVAIDLVADDMTRAGIDLSSSLKPDQIAKLKQASVRLDIWNKFNDGIKWSRLYGGAIVFMMIEGQDPSTPLRPEAVRKGQFKGLLVFDRWMVDSMIGSGDLVQEMGPHYGLPKFYKTIDAPGVPKLKIHHSRVVRLEGIKLPYNQRIMEQLWGLSIIERIYDRMVNFDCATQGMAQLMYKAHYRVMKIKGLRQIAAAGGTAYQGLLALTQLMSRFQGIESVTLIDADDEYEGTEGGAGGVAGVGEGLSAFAEQLSGALQIPLTRLFGQSPGGLNSSGDGELRMYYDGIKQSQESQLKTGVHMVYRVMSASEGTPLEDTFDFEFKSLYQMSDQQQAEVSARDTESVLAAEERSLISKQTALKELQQRGRMASRWSNITETEINAADDEVAPSPEELTAKAGGAFGELGQPKTPPKKKAGDRQLPLIEYGGMPIIIECFKGQERWPGATPVAADYGHIWATSSAEGREEAMDCFIGSVGVDQGNDTAYVIDQYNRITGQFDEHKVFLGMSSLQEATDCWDHSYRGSMMERRGAHTVSNGWLRSWLKTGNMREPVANQLSRKAA